MDTGLVQKIAVLGKDYYTIATITDLFIFAGAMPDWWVEPARGGGSARMHHVFGWVEGIERHAPDQVDSILEAVVVQLLENEYIPDPDKNFLRRKVQMAEQGPTQATPTSGESQLPQDVEKLLEILLQGLRRAMFPLEHRRKGLADIGFDSEYDVQDLLHVLLRPWIHDIRTEEYTPSYAGSSSRIDFLLAKYGVVLEVKYVRDKKHAKRVGDELILDVAHYRVHSKCDQLWCVVYDPGGHLANPHGLKADLEKEHLSGDEKVCVRVFVLGA